MAIAGANWRDAHAYERLLAGDRRCFAWEWLRRAPAYVEAWKKSGAAPGPCGLIGLEDPGADALSARPLWRSSFDRAVLHVEAGPPVGDDCLDLGQFAGLLSIMSGDEAREHVLLSDGLRSIRLDVIGGSLRGGPAIVKWRVNGIAYAGPQLLALRQLSALVQHGRFARSLHRPERRARHWAAMLRVHDAIAAGQSHRDIVPMLLGVDVSGVRWRTGAGDARSRVQRLAAGARAAVAAGPAPWLTY